MRMTSACASGQRRRTDDRPAKPSGVQCGRGTEGKPVSEPSRPDFLAVFASEPTMTPVTFTKTHMPDDRIVREWCNQEQGIYVTISKSSKERRI